MASVPEEGEGLWLLPQAVVLWTELVSIHTSLCSFQCPGPQGPCDALPHGHLGKACCPGRPGVPCPRGDAQSGEISPAGEVNLDLFFYGQATPNIAAFWKGWLFSAWKEVERKCV